MIGNIVLDTSETTIKATSTESFALISLVFCNTSTTERGVTVYAYPDGGSAGDGTTIIKDLLIPGKDTFVWTADEKLILGPDTTVSGLASAGSAITVTWNGLEL
jgi:hypothetical protein